MLCNSVKDVSLVMRMPSKNFVRESLRYFPRKEAGSGFLFYVLEKYFS